MRRTKILTKKNQVILYKKLTDYLFADHNYSYGELAYFSDYFETKARRYGLVKEFKENGII